MYPIKYNADFFNVPRNIFVKAVSAELPSPKYWDTTPMAEGYVKPLYWNNIYQKKIAIGKNGFPWNVNQKIKYHYPIGMCPVTEKLYKEELIVSPLVREGISYEDISDFADAIEKVILNIDLLRENFKSETAHDVYDPIKAIEKESQLMENFLRNKKVVGVFSDPGGAKSILSYLNIFKSTAKEIKTFTDKLIKDYSQFNIEINELKNLNYESVLNEIDVLITGTSMPTGNELRFLEIAKKKGIFSISIIDHWTNFKNRFLLEDNYIYPNLIAVIDEKAKKIAVEEGIPSKLLSY